MKKIEIKTHLVYLDNQEIIHIDVREGSHVELGSLQEVHKACNQLAGNKKKLVIVDASPHHTMTDEAMDYLKKQMMDKGRLASAIISENLGVRIMIDYLTNVLKTQSTVKMFSSEPEAIKWLLGFKNQPVRY